MGQIIEYYCQSCGYSHSTSIGSGFMNMHECWMPALDRKAKEIAMIDVRQNIPLDSDVILYTDEQMYKPPFFYFGRKRVNDYGLPWKYNLCPKCNKYKMKFSQLGVFD